MGKQRHIVRVADRGNVSGKDLDTVVDTIKDHIPKKEPMRALITPVLKKLRKQYCVEMMGGKCEICGERFPNCAMDFHHVAGTKVKLSIGTRLSGYAEKGFWEKLVPEIKNECRLLCSNCHRVLHHGDV